MRAHHADCMARIAAEKCRDSFAEVFDFYAPRVKSYMLRLGANQIEAEDLAQDVMVTVWKKAHLFDPARASVATWVFTIARNRRIDLARREKRPEPEDLGWGPEPDQTQDETLVMQQDSDRLGTALAALPDAQRLLIEQCYFGELSHRDIADVTGLPLGTIKSRIRLALDKLRHAMGSTP